MPEYRYTVVDAKGQTLRGTLNAEDEETCLKIIRQRGLYCLELDETSLATRSITLKKDSRLSLKDLAVFCRQFATMLSAGVGVIKSLDILFHQMENQAAKAIVKKVYETVQRGQSLSTALHAQEGAFPPLLIHMLEAGEASGALEQVMERSSEHFEKDLKMANKIKNAMIYPAILGFLTIAVVVMLLTVVLPTFVSMYASMEVDLPLPTRILLGLSSSLTGYWYVYIIVLALIILAFMRFIKSPSGRLKFDKLKTTAPVIGRLNVIVICARFARTLSTLIQSGLPMLRSLEIASRVLNNAYYEKALVQVREDIRKGMSLSLALKRADLFPPMLVSMISVGEESGALEDVLGKSAAFYDEESDSAITRMVGLLEPAMIIVMALVVAFVLISVVTPMYGMLTNIR